MSPTSQITDKPSDIDAVACVTFLLPPSGDNSALPDLQHQPQRDQFHPRSDLWHASEDQTGRDKTSC
jgi:hypothetical protein